MLNIFDKHCEKYLMLSIKDIEQVTLEFIGISVHSVSNIWNKIRKTGILVLPNKKINK